jgi:hypothetical protein
MKTVLKSTLMCGSFLVALPVASAFAETSYPRVDAVIPFEIQNDYAYESDDPTAELNNTFAVIEPEVTVHFSDAISIVAGLVLENVNDPVGDRFFEDQGLFIEQLFAQYSGDNFNVKAGKFNPTFGIAWDKAPGIYGVDFAEDYELTEKIGFGADVTFGDEASGEHTLSGSTFFADTSFLAQTFINSRGQPRIGDSGPSNTEDLSSFAVSLDSESVPALGGIGYTLGVSHQGKGRADTNDETSYAVGVFGSFELSEDLTLEPLIEYVRRDNAGATIADTDYLTLSSALLHGPWNLAASYTNRNMDPNTAGTPDVEDHLYQVSGGYAFENGLTADLAYRFAEEANIDTHIIGLLFTYELELSSH